MNQNLRGWTVSLLVLALCSFFTQCANIVPPGGGPRDTLPPRLVHVAPLDSTLNFNSSRVVFQFNEFVELDNVIEKLIVSPTMKRTPVITAKLRVVTLEIKDSLQPNTTYTFNFGDAVKDVNERNPIEDFQYVVSTGDYMDSLQLTGKVLVAETGKPDSNIAVMLYSNLEDSVVSKEKPLYLSKTKGDGSYRFRNLKPGTYRLFALKEEDRDYQYTQPDELIAFSDSLVHLSENLYDMNLALFNEVDTIRLEDEPEVTQPEPEKDKDKEKKRKPRLQVGFDLNGGQQELGDSLTMTFNFPIRSLDTAQIGLYEDTTRKKVPFSLHPADTTAKAFKIAYNWKPGKPYEIILPAGFATDTSGLQTAKADTVNFEAKDLDDYGTVKVALTISDSARRVLPANDTSYQFVIQLVSGTELKYTGVITDGKWERGLVQPGEYTIRVVIDRDKNGKWDTGSYYGVPKKQPETVFSFKEPINIKKNWTVSPAVKL
ncbi:Ig-like domain-containing protein [Chitinophaga sp. GCM10012297]|uniref:Ig-like domain-containing protein n=1 Tax=Chitinophaga chungangae TaxID=2821488 RepID=A0ABS3YDJ5_9BACT|nr:Ig-like domain-containing protein [Chitinophaga chungangae]MBO9152756.1 Ig-like domain-containing protein [Chitinophaga chungangae]